MLDCSAPYFGLDASPCTGCVGHSISFFPFSLTKEFFYWFPVCYHCAHWHSLVHLHPWETCLQHPSCANPTSSRGLWQRHLMLVMATCRCQHPCACCSAPSDPTVVYFPSTNYLFVVVVLLGPLSPWRCASWSYSHYLPHRWILSASEIPLIPIGLFSPPALACACLLCLVTSQDSLCRSMHCLTFPLASSVAASSLLVTCMVVYQLEAIVGV